MSTPWNQEQDAELRRLWPISTAAEIGSALGRTRQGVLCRAAALGLERDPRAGWRRPDATPIGATRVNTVGVCVRKLAATGRCALDWEAEQRLVWYAHHGEIPPGHVVAFKPGLATRDVELITVDRLQLLTRAQVMRRNTFHRYPAPIVRAVQKRAHLTRAIRQLEPKGHR